VSGVRDTIHEIVILSEANEEAAGVFLAADKSPGR